MNTPLFPNGITGLSDTKWSGSQGNAHKLVGVDFRSTPGIVKAHQKLKKISSTFVGEVETNVVTELCKDSVDCSDGSKLWFSSESGKIWRQVGDTFTLIHTVNPATDYKEPDSLVPGIVDTKDIEYVATMSIAEDNTTSYQITQDASLGHDLTLGQYGSLIEVTSGIQALAYTGAGDDGFIKIFNTSPVTGSISQISSLEHDTLNAAHNSLVKIDDTHLMLAYTGDADDGYIKVFTITAGSYAVTQTSVLEHDTADASFNSLVMIDSTHFMLAYTGTSNKGYIKVFSIDGSYAITQVSVLEHESVNCQYNSLVKIDATHFMLSYTGADSDGYVKTFSINGAYAITQVNSLEHDTDNSAFGSLIQIDSTHYALAYTGAGDDGFIKIFSINGSYVISQLNVLEHDTDLGLYNSLCKVDDNHLILAYTGLSSDGYIKTFEFDDAYKLKQLDVLEHDTVQSDFSCIVKMGYNKYLLSYSDSSQFGYLKSFEITETFSVGAVLNPSGNILPEIVATVNEVSKDLLSTISKTITIPSETDMELVVIAGAADDVDITGITFDGLAMTAIAGGYSLTGFGASARIYGYKNPVPGADKNIVVTFSGSAANRFLIAFVVKGVHQTTPFAATTDFGWNDYLTLAGSINYQLRIGAFLTMPSTHVHGALQNEIIINNISGLDPRATISVATRGYMVGTAKIISAEEFSYIQDEQLATVDNDYEYLPQKTISKIYYTNENLLFAIPVDKITSWATNIETIGVFINGDDTYHSIIKQNLELYIGDKVVIAKVDVNGNFIQETALNVASPERIQVLSTFDTDILIGTKEVNKARVLRWDTFSDSWLADDDVFESGINAFIKDDNFTYVSAGDYGRLYFYNGEKLNIQKRIPGTWDSTHKAIINENASAFYMGNPVFGLSNVTGNPTEQGIYGYGNYDTKYTKALSLDYPLPSKEFSGVSIGSILVNGIDMYISYKTGTDVGVAKIDHANKYDAAYIETMMLASLRERNNESITEKICADFISLPTGTSVTIGTKTKYDTDYVPQDVVADPERMSVKTKASTPKIVNLQIKFGLVATGNNSPEIENFGTI